MNNTRRLMMGAAGGMAGYTIATGTSATTGTNYLWRTKSGAQSTWTYSVWLKRDVISAYKKFFGSMTSSHAQNRFAIGFNPSNQFNINNNFLGGSLTSTETFTSTGIWFHVCIKCSSNTITVYIDGVALTMSGTTVSEFINGGLVTVSGYATGSPTWYWQGDMAEAHFIDGTAKAVTDFGVLDGTWKPIEYAGAYGSDGFYLKDDFYIGTDVSGNGNNLTKVGTITQATISPPIGE